MNAVVNKNDVLIAIDDTEIEDLSIGQIHELLIGELYSLVKLTLKLQGVGAPYHVHVLRHKFHEADAQIGSPNRTRSSAPGTPPSAPSTPRSVASSSVSSALRRRQREDLPLEFV
mmetsp:Transcript_30121/g.47193  ORF Transcript_30121/g.47193 Transcript_30121/m.47193 type:complete len:115 (+) Transcript_30121:235-579(+)